MKWKSKDRERLCEAVCPHYGKHPDECGYGDEQEQCPYFMGAKDGYDLGVKDSALIPEDMGVIYNLVRRLQSKYGDNHEGCFKEALELFNKARNDKDRI